MAEALGSAESRRATRPRPGFEVAAAAIALGLIGTSAEHRPLVVWNTSSSSPRGLYSLAPGQPRVGDFVLAWPPRGAARLARGRGYVPPGVPLVKTMAAGPGDRVCAYRNRVWVNARPVAVRRRIDGAGRALPRWSGCRVLETGQMLLLGLSHPASFDGRYFGPVDADSVLGRARLIWST